MAIDIDARDFLHRILRGKLRFDLPRRSCSFKCVKAKWQKRAQVDDLFVNSRVCTFKHVGAHMQRRKSMILHTDAHYYTHAEIHEKMSKS